MSWKNLKLTRLAGGLLVSLLLSSTVSAESPKVKRDVGADGVPVITIKGQKAPPIAPSASTPTEVTAPAKTFKVYELDGEPRAPKVESNVVVVPPPPPIAPNPGSFWGYGYPWGFGFPLVGGFYGPDTFFGPGVGIGPSGNFLNYQNPPVNYQNPPINYQNPPVNYQNPPVNYQNAPANYRPLSPLQTPYRRF